MTGAEVRNFGRCGWRASHMLEWYRSGGVDLSGADIVIILLGTNGGHAAEGETPDNAAYAELAERVLRDVPGVRLYLCTPPNATTDPSYSNYGYAPQVAEAAGFVRRLTERLSLPLIDLASSRRITPETEAELQSNDGLHFNREGYRVLAEEILAAILPEDRKVENISKEQE